MATVLIEPTAQYRASTNSARITLVTPKGDTFLPCGLGEWQPGDELLPLVSVSHQTAGPQLQVSCQFPQDPAKKAVMGYCFKIYRVKLRICFKLRRQFHLCELFSDP